MNNNRLTSEFGICLYPDAATRDAVSDIRGLLPDSPYRDDPPHLTFLRGITCPKDMTDDELLNDVETSLNLSAAMPLHATVRKVDDGYSPRYKLSSVILYGASSEMSKFRKSASKILKSDGYTIGGLESKIFIPHISVRLGVPFNDQAKALAVQNFQKGNVTQFSRWVLYRIVYEGEKRLVKEISLDH